MGFGIWNEILRAEFLVPFGGSKELLQLVYAHKTKMGQPTTVEKIYQDRILQTKDWLGFKRHQ